MLVAVLEVRLEKLMWNIIPRAPYCYVTKIWQIKGFCFTLLKRPCHRIKYWKERLQFKDPVYTLFMSCGAPRILYFWKTSMSIRFQVPSQVLGFHLPAPSHYCFFALPLEAATVLSRGPGIQHTQRSVTWSGFSTYCIRVALSISKMKH